MKELIDQVCALLGPPCTVKSHKSEAWDSETFSGRRHWIILERESDDAAGPAELLEISECFQAVLPEHEFTISGQLVASAGVSTEENDFIGDGLTVRLTCALLLMKED